MTDPKPRRKLAAILAADVVNFSAMMGDDEDGTLRNLKACRALTDESITANHGRIFDQEGNRSSGTSRSSAFLTLSKLISAINLDS